MLRLLQWCQLRFNECLTQLLRALLLLLLQLLLLDALWRLLLRLLGSQLLHQGSQSGEGRANGCSWPRWWCSCNRCSLRRQGSKGARRVQLVQLLDGLRVCRPTGWLAGHIPAAALRLPRRWRQRWLQDALGFGGVQPCAAYITAAGWPGAQARDQSCQGRQCACGCGRPAAPCSSCSCSCACASSRQHCRCWLGCMRRRSGHTGRRALL